MKKYLGFNLFAMLVLVAGFGIPAMAQTSTSGDISGVVTDPTGAAIPGTTVTVVNVANGEQKSTVTGATGNFRLSLLSPGSYKVTFKAANFGSTVNTVVVSVGTVTPDDAKLSIGSTSTTVEVSSVPEVVNTVNADVTTTFTAEQVAAMPNPGNDLTFVAQTAPGSVMNTGTTAGGYGNFSSFGLPGLSNMFTLDGGYENDPFLNLNNTGASNLTLGNNEVDTVTVVSPAFSAQYGGLGGAQVNEITTSGTNHIHGNLSYYWDGSALNSNDFFNKLNEQETGTPNKPTRVNANQYTASIGGPLLHDRLFLFANFEGIRATTPASGTVTAPGANMQACSAGTDGASTAAQNAAIVPYDHYILNDIYGAAFPSDVSLATYTTYLQGTPGYSSCGTLNYTADVGSAAAYYNDAYNTGAAVATSNNAFVGALGDAIPFMTAPANQRALLNTIYGVYNNSPYRKAVQQNPNDPSTVTYYAQSGSLLTEWLLTGRLDYKISDKDNFYIHYKQDHGLQPTSTDLLDPRFTVQSVQPAFEGQMNETHAFTPNFTNQLVVTGNWYSAKFQNSNSFSSIAPYTIEFESGSLGTYAYPQYAFPQGRNVAGYQVIDDVAYSKGRNTIRWGYNIRRDNISDIQGEETTTPVGLTTQEAFTAGALDFEYVQRFPSKAIQPVSVYDMGAYIEDTFKLKPNLTVTAGLRLERNSNPVCHTDCFQHLALPVASLPTGAASTTAPYNAAFPGGLITAGHFRALPGFQRYAPMPRVSFNYEVTSKTDIRGGFGMFSDSFPGVVADDLLSNAPTNFHGIVYGYLAGGAGANPMTPGTTATYFNPIEQAAPTTLQDGGTVATASNTAFQSGFKSGQNYTQVKAAVTAAGGHYSAPSFTTTAPHVYYPTYEEWSMAIERRIDAKSTIAVTYVGNHGYHEPVVDGSRNLSNTGAAKSTFFPTVPTAAPVTSFATITNVYSGASSNFNGVVFTATRRSKDLTVNFNYEFSKALDEISNGGFEPYAPDNGDSSAVVNPQNLHSNYGLADYSVKHNITSSFVYSLPRFFGDSFASRAVGGIEISGDVFHQSGLPYSVTQSTSSTGSAAIGTAFSNGGVTLLAHQLNNNFDHHCGGGSHIARPDNGVVVNPCNFISSFATPTSFTQGSRNSLIGPSYTNVDLGVFKTFNFNAPFLPGMKLKLGAQFFNFFNHTNFQNPDHGRSSDNTSLGGIGATVGAPTSILGSVGGADAAPRLIQLHGELRF